MKHLPRKKQEWKFHTRFKIDENEELLESNQPPTSQHYISHMLTFALLKSLAVN